MTPHLTPAGYSQTKAKLAGLEKRLADVEKRTDLTPLHLAEVRRSYKRMIRRYRREIKLYEAILSRQSQTMPMDADPGPIG